MQNLYNQQQQQQQQRGTLIQSSSSAASAHDGITPSDADTDADASTVYSTACSENVIKNNSNTAASENLVAPMSPSTSTRVKNKRLGPVELDSVTVSPARAKASSSSSSSSSSSTKFVSGATTTGTITSTATGASNLKSNDQSIIILINTDKINHKTSLLIGVSKDISMQYNAKDLIQKCFDIIDGKGGGNSDFAQASGKKINAEEKIIKTIQNSL